MWRKWVTISQTHRTLAEKETQVSGPLASGWYPDPWGGHQQRFFDGVQWTAHYAPLIAKQQFGPPHGTPASIVAPPKKAKRNPLFLFLAVLSGIPTAFFGFVFLFVGQSMITGLTLIWCFMWTWVWWEMSDRYR
jgi:hypothetical protein